MDRIAETYPRIKLGFSEEKFPLRGTIADPSLEYDCGKADFQVEEKNVPLQKRQAAVTESGSLVAVMEQYFELILNYERLTRKELSHGQTVALQALGADVCFSTGHDRYSVKLSIKRIDRIYYHQLFVDLSGSCGDRSTIPEPTDRSNSRLVGLSSLCDAVPLRPISDTAPPTVTSFPQEPGQICSQSSNSVYPSRTAQLDSTNRIITPTGYTAITQQK